MDAEPVEVVVLVCCYNARGDLPALLTSLTNHEEDGIDRRIVVLDNGSTDGSGAYVKEAFPSVDCVRVEANRGFAGGNNAGYDYICEAYPKARYLVLLNADTSVARDWLRPLVDAIEKNPDLAAAQPTLRLDPETELVNTTGGVSHYLGFGMMRDYRQPASRAESGRGAMHFPSGAAVMLRRDLLDRTGLFDERFYMYLEDADLGWALRQMGYRIEHVPESLVYHKYAPTAPTRHYRHLERNRWLLLLTYYRASTLVLLGPALMLMEMGQLAYSAQQGMLFQKLRAYRDLLHVTTIRHVWRRRRDAQRRRAVSDAAFLGTCTGAVSLPDGDPWALRWLANPLLRGYWAIARRGLSRRV
jgi:GT2 family glycosyltransferase